MDHLSEATLVKFKSEVDLWQNYFVNRKYRKDSISCLLSESFNTVPQNGATIGAALFLTSCGAHAKTGSRKNTRPG